jgi:hypothetical protein
VACLSGRARLWDGLTSAAQKLIGGERFVFPDVDYAGDSGYTRHSHYPCSRTARGPFASSSAGLPGELTAFVHRR